MPVDVHKTDSNQSSTVLIALLSHLLFYGFNVEVLSGFNAEVFIVIIVFYFVFSLLYFSTGK